MKLILVCLCLLSKATAFPTESPPKAEGEKPCCDESPKLVLRGYDSKHGINVFLFEFPPMKKEKIKNEDYTAELGLDGPEKVSPNTETGKQLEHVVTETNTPAYSEDSDMNSGTIGGFANGPSSDKQNTDSIPSGMSSNAPKNDFQNHDSTDFDTIRGPRAHAQTEQYNEHEAVKKPNLALGDGVKNVHNRKIQENNEQSGVSGYYSTDRIIFADIPGYNNGQEAKQGSTVQFSSKEEDLLECMKTDGSCKNSSKHRKDTQVQPPTYKKVDSAYLHDSDINFDTVSNSSNDSLIKGDNRKTDSILSQTSINATIPNNTNYYTNSGPKGVRQNKLYGEHERVQNPNIELGDQAKHTNREVLNANEQSVTDGYYSTEGITLTDIPGYSDGKVTTQDPNIQFPSKAIDMLNCNKTDGLCENNQVSNASTHKKVYLDTNRQEKVTQAIKDHTKKSGSKPQKIVTIEKHKGNKPPVRPNANNKLASTKYSISRGARNGNEHRRLYNGDQFLRHQNQRHSSSESDSDSSQEFD